MALKIDDGWSYPASVIDPSKCESGKLYRVKFFEDDWDFSLPGDAEEQPIPE